MQCTETLQKLQDDGGEKFFKKVFDEGKKKY